MKKRYILLLIGVYTLFGATTRTVEKEYVLVKEHYAVESASKRIKTARLRASIFRAELNYSDLKNAEHESIMKFLADERLDVIETAIMEEVKFGIPAEITIAQAIIETGYGRHVKHKNWFGIKAKHKGQEIITREHLTSSQMKGLNIIRYKSLGDDLYECVIVDKFTEYPTDWTSWRHHSTYLMTAHNPSNPDELLYGFLFSSEDYRVWAYGLEGRYATDKNYAENLISIIKKYKLYNL